MKYQIIIFSSICFFYQSLNAAEVFRLEKLGSCLEVFGALTPTKRDISAEVARIESGDTHKIFKSTSEAQSELDHILSATESGDTYSLKDIAEISSDMKTFMETNDPIEVGFDQLKLLHETLNLQRILLLYLVEFDLKLEINKSHEVALNQIIRFMTSQDEILVMDAQDKALADSKSKKLAEKCNLAPSLLKIVQEYPIWCQQRNIPVIAAFSTYLKNLESVFCSKP